MNADSLRFSACLVSKAQSAKRTRQEFFMSRIVIATVGISIYRSQVIA